VELRGGATHMWQDLKIIAWQTVTRSDAGQTCSGYP
jgi:hypothetical protein